MPEYTLAFRVNGQFLFHPPLKAATMRAAIEAANAPTVEGAMALIGSLEAREKGLFEYKNGSWGLNRLAK